MPVQYPGPAVYQFYSMHHLLKFFTAFILFALLIYSAPALSDENIVLSIRQAYEEGDINQAEFLALRALKQANTLSQQELLEVHKLLAFCYVASNDNESAISEFMEVLELNPRLILDPLYVSPKIINVFEETKVRFRNRPIEKQESLTLERVRLTASMHSLVLPGWGQWTKGQRTRGYVFLTTQGVTLGTWLGMMIIVDHRYNEYHDQTDPVKIENAYRDYKTAVQWRNAMGLSALAVYVGSFLDTLYGPDPLIQPSMSIGDSPSSTPQFGFTVN